MQFGGGKKAAKAAFAYGLPGNVNAVGGEPLNFDPAEFGCAWATPQMSEAGVRSEL